MERVGHQEPAWQTGRGLLYMYKRDHFVECIGGKESAKETRLIASRLFCSAFPQGLASLCASDALDLTEQIAKEQKTRRTGAMRYLRGQDGVSLQ
jgi:hypothetical protein